MRRVTGIRALLGDRLDVLVGVDDAIVEGIAAGAVGWIAGLVNALPGRVGRALPPGARRPARGGATRSTAGSCRCCGWTPCRSSSSSSSWCRSRSGRGQRARAAAAARARGRRSARRLSRVIAQALATRPAVELGPMSLTARRGWAASAPRPAAAPSSASTPRRATRWSRCFHAATDAEVDAACARASAAFEVYGAERAVRPRRVPARDRRRAGEGRARRSWRAPTRRAACRCRASRASSAARPASSACSRTSRPRAPGWTRASTPPSPRASRAASGRALHAAPAGAGRGVRRQQLPARVLGRRRRHRVRAGRGLPGRREGAPRAPGHVRAGGRRDRGGRRRRAACRRACSRCCSTTGSRWAGRSCAIRSSARWASPARARAARRSLRIAAARPQPIPVFAEMGSVNPVLVLPGALAERGRAIAEGLHASVTLGVGPVLHEPRARVRPGGQRRRRVRGAPARS